jgi:hypothetical protein
LLEREKRQKDLNLMMFVGAAIKKVIGKFIINSGKIVVLIEDLDIEEILIQDHVLEVLQIKNIDQGRF